MVSSIFLNVPRCLWNSKSIQLMYIELIIFFVSFSLRRLHSARHSWATLVAALENVSIGPKRHHVRKRFNSTVKKTTISHPNMNANLSQAFILLNDSTDIFLMSINETDVGCVTPVKYRYSSVIGVDLAMPQWQALVLTLVLSFVILVTIIGNTLVILSVFTYKPLRIVQNFFIVSLAVADLTVAVLVMPFNVVNMIIGRWEFGIEMCKMWLTSDVLCCTSSILNLCAIALDRYWAITDPINYAQKRTVERVLFLIAFVWILSLVISSPPLIGWNDWPEEFDSRQHPCVLNSNPGYRVYSALGSFFIPLVIMSVVYIEIYIATRRRLRERARASRINPSRTQTNTGTGSKETGSTLQDGESLSSETNHNERPSPNIVIISDAGVLPLKGAEKQHAMGHTGSKREKSNKTSIKTKCETFNKEKLLHTIVQEDSITDLQDLSSESNKLSSDTTTAAIDSIGGLLMLQRVDHGGCIDGGGSGGSGRSNGNNNGHGQEKPMRKNSVYQFIEEKQKISLSKERRAARTLGIIMGVFIMCWVPFFLVYIIVPFCPTCCPSDALMDALTWLGYVNSRYSIWNIISPLENNFYLQGNLFISSINPCVYTIFNLDYRRAFKKLLGIKP